MVTRADFCAFSDSSYTGRMVCPKDCCLRGSRQCCKAVGKFQKYLKSREKNNNNKRSYR